MAVADSIGTSVIRTVVPLIVGAVGGVAVKVGLHTDDALVSEVATTVVGGVYYAAVRLLESRVNGRFGWLLGHAGAPKYDVSTAGNDASWV